MYAFVHIRIAQCIRITGAFTEFGIREILPIDDRSALVELSFQLVLYPSLNRQYLPELYGCTLLCILRGRWCNASARMHEKARRMGNDWIISLTWNNKIIVLNSLRNCWMDINTTYCTKSTKNHEYYIE